MLQNNKKERTRNLVALALLTALVVVLQLMCNVLQFGQVTITLSLVPIVIGAALLGPAVGIFLGAVLGLVNFIASFGNPFLLFLFESAPVAYAVVCFGKTMLAGAVAGLIYLAFRRRERSFVGVCLASLAAPVVNTGFFLLMTVLFLREPVTEFFGGAETVGNIVIFVMTTIITFNFFIEFGLNAVLCPAIDRILHAVRRQRLRY